MLRRGYDTWPDPRHRLEARGLVEMVDRVARTGWRPRPDITRIPDQPSSIAAWTSATRPSRRPSARSFVPGSTSTFRTSSVVIAAAALASTGPRSASGAARSTTAAGSGSLAGRVRRPGAVPSVPGDLPRGGGAGGGAAAPRGNRARDGGADDHRPQEPRSRRRATSSRCWRPTRSGARGSRSPGRARTSQASAPPRGSTATASCSTGRRSGRRTRTSPTSASSSRDPTRSAAPRRPHD